MPRLFHSLILTLMMLLPATLLAASERSDTLSEVTVTAIKQSPRLDLQPVASTTLSGRTLERQNIDDLHEVSELVPNFFMPNYGSRITSSIYVRGLGSRMDQSAIGMNVDNIPVLNKNEFDFDLFGIERVEVIRGPQSVLYGRNTMGGVINIYTLSPMRFQGLRMLMEAGAHNTYRVGAGVYHKFDPRFALGFEINGFATAGEFQNLHTLATHPNQKRLTDQSEQYSGRLKLAFAPTNSLSIDNVTSYNYTRQGGYPYRLYDAKDVNYNDTCYYNRTSLSNGTTLQWRTKHFTLSSITGLRLLDDDMALDQDFTPKSYFTLQQTQREYSATQDLVMRGTAGKYTWLGGLFGFVRSRSLKAPVHMLHDGIAELILANMPKHFEPRWDTESFYLNSEFQLPTWGVAAYHESRLNLSRWTLTGALRLDYEHTAMRYQNDVSTAVWGKFRGPDQAEMRSPIEIHNSDRLAQHFLQLLPSVTATYHLPMREPSTLYASVAKGFKSGGYNTQMFSDLLQSQMQMGGNQPAYDPEKVTKYRPETSWTYELGGHFSCWQGRVQTNLTAFYIDVRNQQLTVFPDGKTTGRMMTNAGRSRSTGLEVAISATPTTCWTLHTAYGLTNAKFLQYDDQGVSYRGKYVPYAPAHTLMSSAIYRQPINFTYLQAISAMVDCRAAGPIYWDEANTRRQDFYALLGSSIRLEMRRVTLDIWARNILNTPYHTFYFKSMQREFVQQGQGRHIGITLRYTM